MKVPKVEFLFVCVFGLLISTAPTVLADWDPCDPNKWVQLPDLSSNGVDVHLDSDVGIWRRLGDDFLCTNAGRITDVHLWCSWLNDFNDIVNYFRLSICSDVNDPCDSQMPWSHPGVELWSKHFYWPDDYVIGLCWDIWPEVEWFWDPVTGEAFEFGDQLVWQYNFFIDPCEAFIQQGTPEDPCVYWLVVEADLEFSSLGWKTRNPYDGHFNDDGVWWDEVNADWKELRYPRGHPHEGNSIDLAFVINGYDITYCWSPNSVGNWSDITKWVDQSGIPVWSKPDGSIESKIRYPNSVCTLDSVENWPYTTNNRTRVYKDATLNIVPGGSLIGPGWFRIGTAEGPGTVNQTGGFLKLKEGRDSSKLVVGDAVGSAGSTYTISGGTITYDTNDGGDGQLCMGDRGGSGTFSVVGSAPIIQMEALLVGGLKSSRPATGNLEFRIGASGVSSIDVEHTTLDPNGPLSMANLLVSLTAKPPMGDIVLVRNSDIGSNSMIGIFDTVNGLPAPEGVCVTMTFGGVAYSYTLTYQYDANGDGVNNDIALIIRKPLAPHTKWSQPPFEVDPNSNIPRYCGWDEESHNKLDPGTPLRKIVADDFRCIGSMPITSIHWWGSFFDWEWLWAKGKLPPVLPEKWWIGFWSNVPAFGPPLFMPYSYPEFLLHSITIPANRVALEEVGSDEYYGYYPYDVCYQFNVDLEPDEFFWQDDFNNMTFDNIYWISIVAEYNDVCEPNYPWGWKSRPWSWMDDAVTFTLPYKPDIFFVNDPCQIFPIVDPCLYESADMAFELDTDPNYIKWEQRYTGIRHWPHYEDEFSMATGDNGQPIITYIVADDWRCVKRTPITAIAWWGSYIGYGYEACSGQPISWPMKPDYFQLNIWTDVAAGEDPCVPYSHPKDIIWEYRAYDYDEVPVGYDKHPYGEQNELVFRYSVRLPEEAWFNQPDYNDVFWLSVVAVYDMSVPDYDWGWTNHKHIFNDNAVVGGYVWEPEEMWHWQPLYDQTGASEDMSFMLFTNPNECVNCADYNTDFIINFKDYADFSDDWLWEGPSGGYNNSDLDCDGDVDWDDAKIFVDQWLNACP